MYIKMLTCENPSAGIIQVISTNILINYLKQIAHYVIIVYGLSRFCIRIILQLALTSTYLFN